MMPKAAARRAGAVYMLSFRYMALTVTPFSPINERQACRANVQRYTNVKTNRLTGVSSHHALYITALPGPRMKPRA